MMIWPHNNVLAAEVHGADDEAPQGHSYPVIFNDYYIVYHKIFCVIEIMYLYQN